MKRLDDWADNKYWHEDDEALLPYQRGQGSPRAADIGSGVRERSISPQTFPKEISTTYNPTAPDILDLLYRFSLTPQQLQLVYPDVIPHRLGVTQWFPWKQGQVLKPKHIILYLRTCQSWVQARITLLHEVAHVACPPLRTANGRWNHHGSYWKATYNKILREEGPRILPPEFYWILAVEQARMYRSCKAREIYCPHEGAGPNNDFSFGGNRFYA